MQLSPVVLFAFNRLGHLKRTIEALKNARLSNQSHLIVFSDGARDSQDLSDVQSIRIYLAQLDGFESIHVVQRTENFGLARNVIDGMNEVFEKYKAAIVLEDDIEIAPNFLEIMNELLRKYAGQLNIGSLSGYRYPMELFDETPDFFLLPRASSWGWATWADRWLAVDWSVGDFDDFYYSKKDQVAFNSGGQDLSPMLIKWKLGLNNSWAIRWTYHHYKNDLLGLFPKHNMVYNHGNDGSGTHSPKTNKYGEKIVPVNALIFPELPEINNPALIQLQKFFKLSIIRKSINKVTLKYKPEKK